MRYYLMLVALVVAVPFIVGPGQTSGTQGILLGVTVGLVYIVGLAHGRSQTRKEATR